MTGEEEKEFDAVQLMRSLREQLSRDTAGMSFEEEKEHIRSQIKSSGKQSADADRRENDA